MDDRLMKIVTPWGLSIRRCVNLNVLKGCTESFDLSLLNRIRWDQIEHLYILGSSWNIETRKLATAESDELKIGCYINRERNWLLVIGPTVEQIKDCVYSCSENLKTLKMRFVDLKGLDISHLTGITHLDITESSLEGILDLNGYDMLRELRISKTKISEIRLSHSLMSLRRFTAWDARIMNAEFLQWLPNLEYLELTDCPINRLPKMDQLVSLRYLYIGRTQIENLDDVGLPLGLKRLMFNGTMVRRIPSCIREMKNLKDLDISDLMLDELPDWLPELGMDFTLTQKAEGICLSYTQVKGVDMSIFSQPQEVILQWFENRKKAALALEEAPKPLHELKVVFLGDGEAGKSHTIARLMNDGGDPLNFPGVSTPGIVIKDKAYDIGGREIQVHFWDFGGQEILHSMHRMFLTQRTLYVVVLNARDNKQNDQARYWLHNIKSFADGAPVLLVLNKMDQNPYASINENDLRSLYPNLTEVVRMSAKEYSREEFNREFVEALKRQIGACETLESAFLPAWSKLKNSLRTMKEHYIRGSRYNELSQGCGVAGGEEIRKALLNWFNDLGVSFCYCGSAKLEDYVILRPDWITNAIYIILFNKIREVQNGLVSHEAIHRLLKPAAEDMDKIHRVLPDVVYEVEEVAYVLNVIRKFRLSFQVEDNMEFIPMLCDSNSLPVAAEYEKDMDALEFRMVYDYLPNNVLHRLMVERHRELDRDHVWLTGSKFVYGKTGLSAVVKSEGNLIRIFVRGENSRYTPDMYLDLIRDDLERINRDMNLTVAEKQVAYKADGIVDCFDYEDLLFALECGDTMIPSRARRKKVPIRDILRQTDHGVDEARQRLILDVVRACQKMQDNRDNWDRNEDGRTTYIRDILDGPYIVKDQTRAGRSELGKTAGELDLEIRRENNTRWTMYEALNLSGQGDSQIDYWDRHLKKLLDNYNSNGLPFLFHVSYVERPKDKFGKFCAVYHDHLRFHSPEGFPLLFTGDVKITPDGYDPNHFIQAARCVYDCGGFPTTVYHLFVRVGE